MGGAGAPAVAMAVPMHEVPDEHPGRRHAEYPNLVGAKLGYLSLWEPEPEGTRYVPAGFVGVFAERAVVHNWLEVELTAGVGFTADKLSIPIDLHFKKPFHPTHWLAPYVGVGPLLAVVLEPRARLWWGATTTVGAYVWLGERIGLDVELDYNIAVFRRAVGHDLLVAVGPVGRF